MDSLEQTTVTVSKVPKWYRIALRGISHFHCMGGFSCLSLSSSAISLSISCVRFKPNGITEPNEISERNKTRCFLFSVSSFDSRLVRGRKKSFFFQQSKATMPAKKTIYPIRKYETTPILPFAHNASVSSTALAAKLELRTVIAAINHGNHSLKRFF